MIKSTLKASAVLLSLLALPAGSALAAGSFSHAAWDSVLSVRVHHGWVDYYGLHHDRSVLDRYLVQLATARPEQLPGRRDSLAFFINAFNALAVNGVLNRYPINSVIRLHRGLFSWLPTPSFFRARQPVARQMLSLDDIEHGILRARLHEPRTTFALTWASVGCPLLRSSAYVPDSLEHQLESQTVLFVNDPLRNRWDARRKIFLASRVFHWVNTDFGGEPGGVKRWIRRYYRGALPADFTLQYQRYNWMLNGR